MGLRSIIHDRKKDNACFLCRRTPTCYNPLDEHHTLGGTTKRHVADSHGLTVFICRECHRKIHSPRTEADKMAFDYLQKVGQAEYEDKIGTREQFIKEYGKDYLQDEDKEYYLQRGE